MRTTAFSGAALTGLLLGSAPALGQIGGPITPTIMPAPPPTQPDPGRYGPFPVGLWVPGAAACGGSGDYLRLRKDHSYEQSSGRRSVGGSWRIAAGQITFAHRDAPPMATNDMERSSPVVRRSLPIRALAENRMTLGGSAWKRCSRDPDFYRK